MKNKMRLYGLCLLFLVLGALRGMAQQGDDRRVSSHQDDTCVGRSHQDETWEVLPWVGYGGQDFRWSIAGNSAGQNPNIYSELKWKGLKGPAIGASVRYGVWRRWALIGEYSQLFIRSGSVSDIDYQENNRQDASYHGYFNSDQGSGATWTALIGYQVVKKKDWGFLVAIGYGGSRQSLYLLDNDLALGGILNSTYRAYWNGPAGKIIASVRLFRRLSVEGSGTYYQVNYHSQADWNLIQTFRQPDSFNDRAKGYGVQAGASLKYRCSHLVTLVAGAQYAYWRTGAGIDELFLTTGETESTQMNGVYSTEVEGRVGVALGF
jgi:hypothetical protein